MERNLKLIYKLTPLFIQNEVIFLSGYEGDLFEYHFDTGRLSIGQSDFIYCTDLFTLIQTSTESKWVCTLVYCGNEYTLPLNHLIDDVSIIYHCDGHEVVLFTEEGWQSVRMISAEILVSEHYPNSVSKPLERGTLQLPHGQCIDLGNTSCVTAITGEKQQFDSILSVSSVGVLFSRETNDGNALYFAPTVDPGVELLEGITINVHAACYDVATAQFYMTTSTHGQQQVAIFGNSGFVQSVHQDERYGTITPLIADGCVALFITGSREGVRIDYPGQSISRQILPGLSTRERIFYETSRLKVVSLTNPGYEKTNILFFHGGPESCEWDSPRMPGLLSALTDETVNFHIVNYAGSTEFGKDFRTAVDGCALSGSLPPLINWINEALNGTSLILCGGSFGGSLALELLGRQDKLDAQITGIVLTNPLLDLNFHIARVQNEGGDMTFFNRKFSEEERMLISLERFTKIVNDSDARAQFVLGRRDEVLTIKPALSLLKAIRDKIGIYLHIDDGGHSTLEHFPLREGVITEFIQDLIA